MSALSSFRIKFCTVYVRDQSTALEWYTTKLPFKVVTDASYGEGKRWIELEIPHAPVPRIVLMTAEREGQITPAENGQLHGIAFEVENVHEACQELKSRGVEITHEPTEESWGSYICFKDLDGNAFIIGKEKKPKH